MVGSRRKKKHISKFWLVVMTLLALVAYLYINYFHHLGKNLPLGERPAAAVRIATLNVNGFRTLSTPDVTAEFLRKTVEDNGVDILFLQEFRTSRELGIPEFKAMFGDYFPYISIDGEQCIASKYPIKSHTQTDFPDSPDSYSTNIFKDADGGEFKIICAHLQTTGLYHFRHLGRSQYADHYKEISETLKGNAKYRRIQAQAVYDDIHSSSMPTILVGDFNSAPLSRVYLMLRKDMYDSYLEKGQGNGSTFRTLKNILRIDYIFHDDNYECLDYYTHDAFLSDHRMVIATLQSK